ncbi:MAG: ABC transporter ATP-binding protein [Cryobacterium sp.]|nr:ABC transporter ATP-binding protein [Oligoflexia bacterium]
MSKAKEETNKTDSLDHYIEAEDFKSKRPSLKVIQQVLMDLAEEKKTFILGGLLVLAGTAATLYEPRLFGRAIDRAIIPRDVSLLGQMAGMYLGLIVCRIIAVIGQQYVFEVLSQSMMQKLRLRVFSLYQRLPVATYDRTPVGRLITRLTNDTSAMSEMFSSGFVTLFGNVLFILGSIVWIFSLNWKLALISLSVFPVLLFFSIRFSRLLIVAYRDSRMRISTLNAFLAENILGMKIVHLFNRVPLHFARFKTVNDSYAESQVAAVRVYAYFQPLITWSSGLGVAMVIAAGGAMALGKGPSAFVQPGITPGELVTFLSFLLALFQPIREVVDKWTMFLSGMTSAERIYSLLDWETELSEAEANDPEPESIPIVGRVEFQNVWFAYEEENWVLRDFNLVIEAGEKVGIVGHTGAGKTTLISLILRFYDPQRGRILIDGQDLREYAKRPLRGRIGVIQQDVFLFSGQVQDNIALWSRPGKISSATQQSLGEMGFEKNLDLTLDERGSNLSMGERQILSFARAIEKSPDLWILDEATANVDSDTEIRFGRALDRATEGKTLLMIAHRLATIRKSDLIVVLHKGALVEKGTHLELLRLGGYYAKLYRYQEAVERRDDSALVTPIL